MSEFNPITMLEDLALQPDCEVMAGYLSGLHGEPEPGSGKSRAYWHGWRNGRVDGGYDLIDAAQRELARKIVEMRCANQS